MWIGNEKFNDIKVVYLRLIESGKAGNSWTFLHSIKALEYVTNDAQTAILTNDKIGKRAVSPVLRQGLCARRGDVTNRAATARTH